ncbi:MAG: trigger factor [Patescibacteria group bacterium]
MKFKTEQQEGNAGEVVLEITIPFAEQKKHLEKAAARLSEAKPIKGFRPGKASFEVVEKAYGGQTILAEAVEKLIAESLFDSIEEKNIKTVGQPKIDIVKEAYGNDFVYKATISLLPEVTIGDLEKVKVKQEKVEATDEEVEKTIDHFRTMRASEKLVDRAAKKSDIAEIDFATTVDKVAIEGGDAKGYKLVLGDGHMIPGFEEQVEGMKKDDKKTFTLNFPKDYKADLAGKEAEFTVTVKSVYERELPKADDAFAQGFGQESLDALKKAMKDNIKLEKEQQEMQRQEVELLKGLVELSEFGPLPELLIENELHRMKHELEDDLSKNGLSYDQYLTNLGKTSEELSLEMKPQAEIRVKTALLLRNIAEQEKLGASDDEIAKEIEMLKMQYGSNPDIQKRVESREYKDYLQTILSNKKAIQWLRDKAMPKKEEKVSEGK